MRRRIMSILMSAALLITGCSSATGGNTEQGTITVGLEANYAPYNWAQKDDSNGAVKIEGSAGYAGGFDVEVAKMIAEKLGKKLVIKQIVWEGLIPAVQNGAIDLIIAGMSETPDRAQSVDFTDPYYDSKYVMIVKKGSQWEGKTGISQFGGARVVGQKGTNFDVVIPQMTGAEHLAPLATVPLIIHAIKTGAADATVIDKSVGISVLQSDPDLAMVELDDNDYFKFSGDVTTACSIALKKGDTELKNKLNEFLKGFSLEDRDKLMEQVVKIQPAGAQ